MGAIRAELRGEVPTICPGCGYCSSDPEEMLSHWMRSGAYGQGPNGVIRFNSDQPHGDNDRNSVIERVNHRLPRRADKEYTIVLVENEIPMPLPRSLRILSMVMVCLGGVFMLIIMVVAGFLFVPVVVHPIVNYGPLTPWVRALKWLWLHGELGVPIAAALAMMLAIPRARRKAWDIVVAGAVYVGLGILATATAGVIFWLAWLALVRPHGM